MEQFKIALIILSTVALGIGDGQRDVCKNFVNKTCRCYKDVNASSFSNKEEKRLQPVSCQGRCYKIPCCNGKSTVDCFQKNNACSSITFVSREQWGAKPPTHPLGIINKPVPMFYIHHTDTPACYNMTSCSKSMRAIQRFHQQDRGWWDIAYSFLVGEDGRVYVGRGWNKVGSHTEGYNSVSYAASFIGNYMDKLPNERALNATKQLMQCGVEMGKIRSDYSLYGHRDACGDTDCPGDDLYKLIHSWKNYDRLPNPSAGCVATGRRCKSNVSTCKPGSVIPGQSLCLGKYTGKYCCKLGKY